MVGFGSICWEKVEVCFTEGFFLCRNSAKLTPFLVQCNKLPFPVLHEERNLRQEIEESPDLLSRQVFKKLLARFLCIHHAWFLHK